MNQKIKNYCDILILFGYNKIIHKDFLYNTKYGILSFHTADINKYRGRPSAFYEFINNEENGGITLQQLSQNIDGGRIIEQRNIKISNCKSYDETLCKMMTVKKDLIINGLHKIENKFNFKEVKKRAKLSINKDSRKLKNVLSCLKKTILKRYIK